MKQLSYIVLFCLITLFIFSCSTPNYFYDASSKQRQQELRNTRSGNVFSDIFLGLTTAVLSSALDADIGFDAHERSFKKLKLINTSADTLYVNMLTDVFWDESNYCDFMDIRIPPLKTCKVMVPLDANYNIYFSNTVANDDDEMIEIFTNSFKRIALKPEMTVLKDSILIR